MFLHRGPGWDLCSVFFILKRELGNGCFLVVVICCNVVCLESIFHKKY